jgi:hypothetical protein
MQSTLLSGVLISIPLSNLPVLRKAGSIASGLLVLPITITCPREATPAIRVNSRDTTLCIGWFVAVISLLAAMLSTSSIKIIEGAFSFAC